MNGILLALALLASPASVPTASATPVTIQGVTLGETATAMIAALGEPLVVDANPDGDNYLYIAATNNAMVFARVVRGNVVGVAFKPAPWEPLVPAPMPGALGISLGDPMAFTIQKIPKDQFVGFAKRDDGGLDATYRGTDGLEYTYTADASAKIAWIHVELPTAQVNALAAAPAPSLHDGTSPADAIVEVAPSDDIGVKAEYVYLALHPCGNGGSWKTGQQSLLSLDGQHYDLLSVVCSDGGAKRDFYFNISAYFGKM